CVSSCDAAIVGSVLHSLPTRRSSDLHPVRDVARQQARDRQHDADGEHAPDARDLPAWEIEQRHLSRSPGSCRAARTRRTTEMSLDRKSTRLNSSHVKISYAVFCLKKE